MGAPDVSVLIAAWNAKATLARAVRSALAQRDVSVEVVVVDDASTDRTAALAEAMARDDPRVRVIRQARNAGPAAARNLALDAARGRHVAPLDADDFMEPGRLAALRRLAHDGDWDMVADDLLKVAEDAPEGPRERLWSSAPIGVVPLSLAAFVDGNLSRRHGGRGELGFLKPLVSREMLGRMGLRYDERMRLGEDFALYAAALARGARMCLTDPAGYVAVVRPGSLSGRHGAAELGALARACEGLRREPDLTTEDRAALRRHRLETQERWRWMRLIEAVRARDAVDAAGCFAAHPRVVGGLAARLAEQARLRSRRAVMRLGGAARQG